MKIETKEISLTQEEVNQLLDYLSRQPYFQVAGLIAMIVNKLNPKQQ